MRSNFAAGGWIALVVLAVPGCHLIYPFDPGDASVPWSDVGPALDVGQAEGLPDPPPDTGPGEAQIPIDGQLSPDVGVLKPCAGGPVLVYFSSTMVACGVPAGGPSTVNQCKAKVLCNDAQGWRLCNATEYKDRGGKLAGTKAPAWIKACVRSGLPPYAPTDGLCDCLGNSTNPAIPVAWPLAGGVVDESYHNVGVSSHQDQHKVGVNQAVNTAYWTATAAVWPLNGAVCCL